MLRDVNLFDDRNASTPMLLRVPGSVMEVMFVTIKNALVANAVTPSGTITAPTQDLLVS
jgi:hypothetical protein